MTFLESFKYELWEFGWDGLTRTLLLLIPLFLIGYGWNTWKNSYSERKNNYGERLEIAVNAQLQSIEPRIYIRDGWDGASIIILGYDLAYKYEAFGHTYEGKDYLPRNREFRINQMIKQLKDTTYHQHLPIRVSKDNPEISQVVIQPLAYY